MSNTRLSSFHQDLLCTARADSRVDLRDGIAFAGIEGIAEIGFLSSDNQQQGALDHLSRGHFRNLYTAAGQLQGAVDQFGCNKLSQIEHDLDETLLIA